MSTSPIPKTAPFAEEDIEILNQVVGTATPIQRAWLAGFLAGLDASSSPAPPASAARPAEPLTIVFGSESGNSERLATDMAKAARKQGFKPSVIDMADLDVTTLAKVPRLIVIAATWGEGDPPSRAGRAYADLMSEKAPRLDNVEFGVLALGDSAYVEFCAVGKAIDARLAALGGKRIAERADLDLDFVDPAARWIESTLKTLAPAGSPSTSAARISAPKQQGRLISTSSRPRSPNTSISTPPAPTNRRSILSSPSRTMRRLMHLATPSISMRKTIRSTLTNS
jgi:sulfite reductase (NADPH) flavoprotein alpha-component